MPLISPAWGKIATDALSQLYIALDALSAINLSLRGLLEFGADDASHGAPVAERGGRRLGVRIEFAILLVLHLIAGGLALGWLLA